MFLEQSPCDLRAEVLETTDRRAHTLINDLIDDQDWYWTDDLSYNKKTGNFDRHIIDINKKGRCGTSNVLHRRDLGVYWQPKTKYSQDDWIFIQLLKMKSKKYKFLDVAGYQICHVPGLIDY